MGNDLIGNQRALKHGGAGAVKSLQTGKPFIGIARDTELQIIDEYEINGPAEQLKKNAIRIQTAAELYWMAIQGATEPEKLESYVKVYGWLATAGARLLGQLHDIQGKETPIGALEVLQSLQGGANDETG